MIHHRDSLLSRRMQSRKRGCAVEHLGPLLWHRTVSISASIHRNSLQQEGDNFCCQAGGDDQQNKSHHNRLKMVLIFWLRATTLDWSFIKFKKTTIGNVFQHTTFSVLTWSHLKKTQTHLGILTQNENAPDVIVRQIFRGKSQGDVLSSRCLDLGWEDKRLENQSHENQLPQKWFYQPSCWHWKQDKQPGRIFPTHKHINLRWQWRCIHSLQCDHVIPFLLTRNGQGARQAVFCHQPFGL